MNPIRVKTMDDLPELPFERILHYLSLEDRLKARAVSRSWRKRFDFELKNLCYSERPAGFILRKRQLVSGAFARRFISSSRPATFFNAFAQTTLSNLKHLRLCEILGEKNGTAFGSILPSFDQLEELDLLHVRTERGTKFELKLPMLHSIRLERLFGIEKLVLDAPRLTNVKIWDCYPLRLNLVHAESVERLVIDDLRQGIHVENLKNLVYLYAGPRLATGPDFLSDLEKLKEIHTNHPSDAKHLLELKRQDARADLKIFYCGLLLNGPGDPALNFEPNFGHLSNIVHLAENPSRLADEIPLYNSLHYEAIERVASGLETNILKRYTDLDRILVNRPVQDIERFLKLLETFDNIIGVWFICDQPQELFDRLPGNWPVQSLTIRRELADFQFLFRYKQLIHLDVQWSPDVETIRKVFEKFEFLSTFYFKFGNQLVYIEIEHPKRFQVAVGRGAWTNVADLNAAIQFITEKATD